MSKFSILSYNIDTNISRTEDGFATKSHHQWTVAKRIPHIIKVIRSINPDIIQFQEGRIVGNIDSVTPLIKEFETDYHIITKSYNPTSKSFIFISCFAKSKFNIITHDSYYITETPFETKTPIQTQEYEKIKTIDELIALKKKWTNINGYEEHEKSFLWVEVECVKTKKSIVAINAHLGVGDAHRLYASDKINDIFTYLTEISNCVVMTGDFNTFPDWKGPEQLEKINIPDLSKKLLHIPDYRKELNYDLALSMKHNSTFHFYPYDYGVHEQRNFIKNNMAEIKDCVKHDDIKGARNKINSLFEKCCNDDYFSESVYPLGGHLDHIFFSNGLKPIYDNAFVIPAWCGDIASVPFDSDNLKTHIIKHLGIGPILASDHQPLLGLFEY